MKVTHYPDARALRNRQPAGVFTGTKWSEAPGTGNWYCLPDGCPQATASIIIATTRAGQSYYVGALPEGVTYG